MSKILNAKAVIFDLDGTLIDTEKYYRMFWPIACRELGFELSDDKALTMRSMGKPYAEEMFKKWFGDKLDYYAVRDCRRKLMEPFVKEKGIDVKPGAIELLKFLKEKNITTAIATATPMERLTECLKQTGLEGYFDKLVSATMVERGKPAPDVYLYACKELGLEPKDCIAVEDSPNGVMSAYNAGCNVILVPDQSLPTEDERKMASLIVENLADIKAYMP